MAQPYERKWKNKIKSYVWLIIIYGLFIGGFLAFWFYGPG